MSMTPERTRAINTFLTQTPFAGAELHPLAGDASFRRYVRVRKGDSVAMLMDAPPGKEDVHPFIAVASYLHKKHFSAPAILASDAGQGFVLLEDLGDDSFTKILRADAGKEEELYAHAIDVLAAWHDDSKGFSNKTALPLPPYDTALLLKEVQLFADWYLPQVMGREKAAALHAEYMGLWKTILSEATLAADQFVHRDYHADNLMWLPSRAGTQKVGLLDFQDAVYGDAAYDMVSLLEDARRDVPASIVGNMLARYIQASGCDRARFMAAYAVLGAQRNSKIVGIFSRLAARDGKQHYLNYLPRVWGHLTKDVEHPSLAILKQWLDKHIAHEWRGVIAIRHDAKALQLSA